MFKCTAVSGLNTYFVVDGEIDLMTGTGLYQLARWTMIDTELILGNDLDRKYGYLVDGPQDSVYVANNNSNDPGGNQIPVLEQHRDDHLHIHSPLMLYPGLNTYFISERRFPILVEHFVN